MMSSFQYYLLVILCILIHPIVGWTSEQKAVTIAPKFTSLMSIMGSSFIVIDVLRKTKKLSTLHRLLIAMSSCDLITSTCFLLTTWPIPEFEPVYGASGTWNTCIVQGFFSQASLVVVFYNWSLTVYYLAAIKWGWSSDKIRIRLEPLLHAIPFILGMSTSLMAIPLRLYNNDWWECWISPFPNDCNESWRSSPEDANCIRGDNASLYRWLFYYMLLWTAILAVTYNMVQVYYAVVKQEKDIQEKQRMVQSAGGTKTDEEKDQIRRAKHSRKVAIQGYWWCAAFYLTWIFPTVTRLVQVMTGGAPFKLILTTAMFVAWQGFFNWLVYIMPRYKDMFSSRKKAFTTEEAQKNNFKKTST